jgi:HlyD family secretion protein
MASNAGKKGLFARRPWIVWAAGAICAVIVLASFAARDDSVTVYAARVSRGTIRSVISTNGKVEPLHNFEAHAPVGTTVKRVLVKEGDHVHKGQLLVELDAAGARSQAAQALAQIRTSQADLSAVERGGTHEEVLTLEAELVKARAERDTAQRTVDALTHLAQTGAAAPGEVKAAADHLAAAAAQVKLLESKQKERYSLPEVSRVQAEQTQAESAYSAAEDVLHQLIIRAPFDGVVYSLPVRQGTYVNPGDLILEAADLAQVRVRAYVDEPDIARLAVGEKIEATWDAIPDRVWTGSVSGVPASIKLHITRNVGETTCTVENPDFKLLPNVNVGVTIITAEHRNALILPREALRLDDGRPYVLQIVNHELERRSVATAISNLTRTEITSGLTEGAEVALRSVGTKPLRDHLSVKAVE